MQTEFPQSPQNGMHKPPFCSRGYGCKEFYLIKKLVSEVSSGSKSSISW